MTDAIKYGVTRAGTRYGVHATNLTQAEAREIMALCTRIQRNDAARDLNAVRPHWAEGRAGWVALALCSAILTLAAAYGVIQIMVDAQ